MARFFRYARLVVIASLALFCAMTVTLWIRSYRSPGEIQFQLPIGLSQLLSDRGSFTLDNAPQHQEEMATETDALQKKWSDAYWQVQNDYIQSGRDLSDPTDAHQAAMREAFDEHLRDLHRYEFEYMRQREAVDARWRVHPIKRWEIRCSIVAAMSGIFPAIYAVLFLASRMNRRRRRRQNRCVTCGYDLRASPGRCPECGRQEMLAP